MFHSMNGEDGLVDDVLEKGNNNMPTSAIRIYNDYIVSELDQLKFADLRCIYITQKKYYQYRATATDKTKGFPRWITEILLHKIMDNERRLMTELSVNMDYYSVYKWPDHHMLAALSRMIRPLSKSDYKRKIFKAPSRK